MRKQCRAEVKFVQESLASSAESPSRRRAEGWPVGVAVGGDSALRESSCVRAMVGRSQGAQRGSGGPEKSHHSRRFCVRDMQLPREAAKESEGRASTLSLRPPRSRPQKNRSFVLRIHRRLSGKAGRSMFHISCSSIFVLVNFYSPRVYITGYPDLQEEELCRSSHSEAWLFSPDLIKTALSGFF